MINAIKPEQHVRLRKALSPAFTLRALREQETILQGYTNTFVECLSDKGNENSQQGVDIDVTRWFNFVTFDIFDDLSLGESYNCLENSSYHPWVELVLNHVKFTGLAAATRFYPLLGMVLFRCIPPAIKKKHLEFIEQIGDKVQRRLNWELERPDIMTYVMKQNGNEKAGMTREEINSTFTLLAIAGSDTSATALSGTINYLVNSPDKLAELTREVRGSFKSRDKITLEALQHLPYLNAVLNEGLRLCPPVPWILPRRIAVGGDTVCGIWLPGGVSASPLSAPISVNYLLRLYIDNRVCARIYPQPQPSILYISYRIYARAVAARRN